MVLRPFAVFVPYCESVELTGFGDVVYAEEFKELLALCFSSVERDGKEDIITVSGKTDHAAHYDGSFDQAEIVFVCDLV